MNSNKLFGLLLAIIAMSGLFSIDAHAQKMPNAVVAVIDMQRIINESLAGANIKLQLDKYRGALQTKVAAIEDSLRKEEAELKRQQRLLAPDVFQEKYRAFQRKVTDTRRRLRERQRQLEQGVGVARRTLLNEIRTIVSDMASKRGINLVQVSAQLVFFDGRLDITTEVMKILNKRLPKVDVPKPADL